ncbi:hypothetical protein TNCV_2403941 [Trichonephila clavipes]|nr:hypothetical protein TNCV_2403941 [Trichonephila clavipes]
MAVARRCTNPSFTVPNALGLRWLSGHATRGILETDHVILNHGQVTWTTSELAPPSPNYHTTATGGHSELTKNGRQHDHQVTKMVTKSPTWSSKK